MTTCDRLVGLHDLMRTLADIVGVELKKDHAPDSISMLPLWKDPGAKPTRDAMVLQATRAMAIRSGAWKLALCPGSGSDGRFGNTPAREQAWRAAVKSFGRNPKSHDELAQAPFVQLFNLDEDLAERKNLAAGHPEKVREMLSLLKQHIDKGRSTPGPILQNDRDKIKTFPAVPAFVWKKTPTK